MDWYALAYNTKSLSMEDFADALVRYLGVSLRIWSLEYRPNGVTEAILGFTAGSEPELEVPFAELLSYTIYCEEKDALSDSALHKDPVTNMGRRPAPCAAYYILHSRTAEGIDAYLLCANADSARTAMLEAVSGKKLNKAAMRRIYDDAYGKLSQEEEIPSYEEYLRAVESGAFLESKLVLEGGACVSCVRACV